MTPLNNVQLELGLRDYLLEILEAAEVTVPAPAGESGSAPRVAPVVICSSAAFVVPENQSYIAVLVRETAADMPGLYGDKMRVEIVTVTPFPYPPGIVQADHSALAGEVAGCFPARPKHGVPDYASELAAWEALNEALSDAVETSAGYLVNGWFVENERTNRTKEQIETILTVRPCVVHPSLV